MDIKNTYFGFTDRKKSLQTGKIEKSLDMYWSYEGKIVKRKVLIYDLLKEGRKPSYEENYSYYSSQTEDYTKPKTLYKLEDDSGTYIEINKTLYNYALHLINSDFLNEEKAEQFIQNEIKEKEEKEKQDQERIQKERAEAERLKQKEDQERKERLERKQKEWYAIGEKVLSHFKINPITEVLDYHWQEIKSIYVNEERENFYNNMHKRFTIMLGNQGGCINQLQYYVENESNENRREYTIKNNPSMTLEKDILFKAFSNISVNDKPITINAKIKAVFDNREYKGGKEPKDHKFYYLERDPETTLRHFREAYGQKLNIEGITCYIRTIEENKYSVVEARTGLGLIGVQDSKSKAIQTVKEKVKDNKDRLETIVQNQIESNGISPLYQDNQAM